MIDDCRMRRPLPCQQPLCASSYPVLSSAVCCAVAGKKRAQACPMPGNGCKPVFHPLWSKGPPDPIWQVIPTGAPQRRASVIHENPREHRFPEAGAEPIGNGSGIVQLDWTGRGSQSRGTSSRIISTIYLGKADRIAIFAFVEFPHDSGRKPQSLARIRRFEQCA